MTALYVWLATAWEWVTGLRVVTRPTVEKAQDYARQVALVEMERSDAHRAHAEKREAQRILAIVTEPLKDWELDDFPELAFALNGPVEVGYELPGSDLRHLANVIAGYATVRREAAQARMSVTTNDMLRDRTWADQPRPRVPSPPPIRRALP